MPVYGDETIKVSKKKRWGKVARSDNADKAVAKAKLKYLFQLTDHLFLSNGSVHLFHCITIAWRKLLKLNRFQTFSNLLLYYNY